MKTTDELLDLMARFPSEGVYRHYKGGLYVVVGRAVLESTLEPHVLYQPFDSPVTFARPLLEWEATVEHEGRAAPRYTPERMTPGRSPYATAPEGQGEKSDA
jgi:hypothetical protein